MYLGVLIWSRSLLPKSAKPIYIYICYPPPPGDLLFRRCMRRKEQMRYTFCFVKKVRRWHSSRRTWYDLDAACNLALSRCHSLCSILSQQSRGKAPLVLMGRADRLHGYMRRTYFWNFRKTPLFAIYRIELLTLSFVYHLFSCINSFSSFLEL